MNELDSVIASINKQYGTSIVNRGTSRILVEKIPFSSPRLNYMTYGGVPVGMVTEFMGSEGGGKTTTCLDVVGQAQKLAIKQYTQKLNELEERLEELEAKNNKSDKKEIEKLRQQVDEHIEKGVRKVAYFDLENTLDEDWAKLMGVDTEALLLIKPLDQTAEQVLQIVIDLVKSGGICLIVIDSVPMLIPQQLYEGTMEDKSFCGIAGPMAIFSSRISPIISKYRVGCIFVNQLRDDIDNKYNMYKTPGGRALRHLYALRLNFRKDSLLDSSNNELKNSAEEPAGNKVAINIVKTKVCKPDRKVGYYTLNYTNGIDILADTIDLGIKLGTIAQRGAFFYLLEEPFGNVMSDADGNEVKFQGKAKFLEYLREDPDAFEELYEETTRLATKVS